MALANCNNCATLGCKGMTKLSKCSRYTSPRPLQTPLMMVALSKSATAISTILKEHRLRFSPRDHYPYFALEVN